MAIWTLNELQLFLWISDNILCMISRQIWPSNLLQEGNCP